MKQGVMGIGLIFTLVLVVSTIMALGTESSMQELLDKTASTIVYQSLEEYMITSEDLEDITNQNISLHMVESGMSVISKEIDQDKEFIQITLEFEYKNFGNTRVIQSSRSALIERRE